MVEYLIIAISFAAMVHFRYIRETLEIIQDLKVSLDIENEKSPFNPISFSIIFFVFSTLFMPFMVLYIFGANRIEVIKDISTTIIKSYFQLEEK